MADVIAHGRIRFTERNRDLIANGRTPVPVGKWHRPEASLDRPHMACGWRPKDAYTLWQSVWHDATRPAERACERCWP